MYSKFILGLFVSMTPFSVSGNAVLSSEFGKGLHYGVRHADVVFLQKILNADRETQIATTGQGSPGNETDYFGPATKRAVVKFQEKHRDEVLTPWGLSRGTGFLGEKTRLKLKTLINKAEFGISGALLTTKQPKKDTKEPLSQPKMDGKVAKSASSTAVFATTSPSVGAGNKVFVMFPSRYSGKPGVEVGISGAGFTPKDNSIYLGSQEISGVPSWNGASLSFFVPSMPKGIYSLHIKNNNGESSKDAFFVVTDGVTPPPKIEIIAPERVLLGSNVVLRGSGFTKTGNMVRTSTEILGNISSLDGTTLSFKVGSEVFESMSPQGRASMKKNSKGFPVWVYVINENGVSNGGMFTLEL